MSDECIGCLHCRLSVWGGKVFLVGERGGAATESHPPCSLTWRSLLLCWLFCWCRGEETHCPPFALIPGKGMNVPFLRGASGPALAGCSGSRLGTTACMNAQAAQNWAVKVLQILMAPQLTFLSLGASTTNRSFLF